MRYVTCMGYVWRLTEGRYAKLNKELRRDPKYLYDLDALGTCLGEAQPIEDIVAAYQ